MGSTFRALHTSCRRLQTSFKTTINTLTPAVQIPTFPAKSVVLLSTVSNLPSITKQAINLYENHNLQVVVAGVDTVKGHWNGVAEFWSDEHLEVDGTPFEESQMHNKNWKPIESQLSFEFGKEFQNKVSMPLANSIFSTGNLVMCFQLHKDHALHDQLLKTVTVKLPGITQFSTQIEDRWTPLFDDDDTNVKRITNFKGNLVKKINNSSAAKYLEQNDRLMSLKSKETEVYVKLTGEKVNRYQVIAGGGGWGAKADTIVISPDAKIAKNDIIQFFMLAPDDKAKPFTVHDFNGLEIECSLPQTSYQGDSGETTEFGSFSFGSELGFVLNGTNHKSAGEVARFEVSR